jgi:hypothetical protein
MMIIAHETTIVHQETEKIKMPHKEATFVIWCGVR